jgi:hypothetical protein
MGGSTNAVESPAQNSKSLAVQFFRNLSAAVSWNTSLINDVENESVQCYTNNLALAAKDEILLFIQWRFYT